MDHIVSVAVRELADHDARSPLRVIAEASRARNEVLNALPAAEFERLAPHLEPVALRMGDILSAAGTALRYVYFPTTAVLSWRCFLTNGSRSEIASVGNEGLYGAPPFVDDVRPPSEVTVQTAGRCYRLAAWQMTREFQRAGALQRLVLRYLQSLFTQVAQTAVCNSQHPIERRLCRWLLLSLDRTPTRELFVTHEQLATALGVRRESISVVAGQLQEAGTIRYRRGRLTVLDRRSLEARVCECYDVLKGVLSFSVQ